MFLVFILSSLVYFCFGGESWSWQTSNMQDSSGETGGSFIGTAPACSAHSSDCAAKSEYYWYSVTSGTGAFCSSGRKVYCNSYASPYSNIYWKGTATFCTADCNDCSGTDRCIVKDGSGDGSDCSCAKGFFGCTNEKVMCVQYRSRRILQPQVSFSSYSIPLFTGIEIGFYVSFGTDFDNMLAFEDNAIEIAEYIQCAADTLDYLFPLIDVTSDLGHVLGYGLVNGNNTGNFTETFGNHNVVPFLNVRFDVGNEEDAFTIQEYLQISTNQEIFSNLLSTKLINSDTWDEHEFIIFVESNIYLTGFEDMCPSYNDDDDDEDEYTDTSEIQNESEGNRQSSENREGRQDGGGRHDGQGRDGGRPNL